MASLADVFAVARLALDTGAFEAEALAVADKAGKNVGEKMSQQLNAKLKGLAFGALGAAAGAAFGIALKGGAELDAAMSKLQADTGMTADEAKNAEHALAGMYANNLQGFDEIGAAMAKVHNDLGLTGAAADAATEKFLKFGTATGQNASEAVSAFDDILDSWNLTAADSGSLMDKLIVSHQKFGGSVADSEKALTDMAPALQAANGSIDDGIALLNLFNSAGVDAADASTALAKAVKTLKPGQSLNDLIKRIGDIEDPTKRAQEAMKIFGARSGIGLAQAIKPGMTSLDDIKAALGDTTGATEKAADAALSWGDKFKLALHQIAGPLADFGTQFGPLLMIAGQIGPKIIASITAIGAALTAEAATAGLKWLAILGPFAVGAAVIVGGLVIFKTGIEAIDSMGRATTNAAIAAGDLNGAQAKLHAGMVAGTVDVDLYDQLLKNLTDQQYQQVVAAELAAGATNAQADAAGKAAVAMDQGTAAVAGQTPLIHGLATAWDLIAGAITSSVVPSLKAASASVNTTSDALTSGGRGFTTYAEAMPYVWTNVTKTEDLVRALPGDLATSLAAGQTGWQLAVKNYGDFLTNHMTVAVELAAVQAALIAPDLVKNLHSSDPAVRAGAEALAGILEDRVFALRWNVAGIALKTGQGYGDALESKKDMVKRAAAALGHPVGPDGELPTPADLKSWGYKTGDAYSQGIANSGPAAVAAAQAVASNVRSIMQASSPPGPASPLHLIDVWGFRTGMAWVDGLVAAMGSAPSRLRTSLGGLSGALPALSATSGLTARMPDLPTGVAGTITLPQVAGIAGGVQSSGQGPSVNIGTINNPVAEPASVSVKRQLNRLAAFGVLGG